MAGPLKTTRTGDLNLDTIQRDTKDFADQLEDARQGVIAYPAKVFTKRAQLRDEAVVVYRGSADSIFLPSAAQRGNGRGQAIFILNEGSGTLTVMPTAAPSAGGKSDVLIGGNAALPVNTWAIFESDGFRTWFALSSAVTAVTSLKAGAGGTPRTGAIELDGTGSVTITDLGTGVFQINVPVAGSSVSSIKANPGGTPQTGALEFDGAGLVSIANAGGVFTITGNGVGSIAGDTGGVQTGSINLAGSGDVSTSGAAGTITISAKRTGSYSNYANDAASTCGQTWFIAGCNSAPVTTTSTTTLNVVTAFPFVAPVRGASVDRLDFEVTTAGAGNGRMALYDNISDTNLYPNNRLADGGSIATTSTGIKSASVGAALTPGKVYWVCFYADTSLTAIYRAIGATPTGISSLLGCPSTGAGTVNMCVGNTIAFGAWPATFPTAGGGFVASGSARPLLRYRLV